MSVSPNELAEKLRLARESVGMSQQVAADAVGLSRPAISQIESVNRSVSTFELMKFAKIYQQPISYFIEDEAPVQESLETLLYRAEPSLGKVPNIKSKLNHYIDICREGINLEGLLGFNHRRGPPVYSLSIPSSKSDAAEQGEFVADQERKRMAMGIEPIADIVELIAKQSIWVSSSKLPKTISGLFLNHSKTGMIILVNAEQVKSRKRFSYAHEYAHALLDRNDPVRISSEKDIGFIEVRANAFAAAFLMPKEAISDILQTLNKGGPSRSEHIIFDGSATQIVTGEKRAAPFSQIITYQDAAIIAHHFGVSYLSAIYRLRNLNYLSQPECEALINKEVEGKNYLRVLHMYADLEAPEENPLWDRELRNELAYLTIEAYRREEISRGKVIELGDQIGIGGKILFDLAKSASNE